MTNLNKHSSSAIGTVAGIMLSFICSSTAAKSSSDVFDPVSFDLKIVIDGGPRQPDPEYIKAASGASVTVPTPQDYAAKWQSGCTVLRGMILNKKQAFGDGAFDRVQCAPFSPTFSDEIMQGNSWILKVSDRAQFVRFEIFFRAPNGKLSPEAAIDFPGMYRFGEFINDLGALRAVATELMNKLPMFSIVKVGAFTGSLSAQKDTLTKKIPDKLIIFELLRDPVSGFWHLHMLGTADGRNETGSTVTWSMSLDPAEKPAGRVVTAHRASGRDTEGSDLKVALLATVKKYQAPEGGLLSAILQSLSSNLSGIRYGYSILRGRDVVTKSAFISGFTEIRSGPADGLRLYYDKAPKVSQSEKGLGKSDLSWTRISLGWNMNLPNLPVISQVFDSWDAGIKFGMFTLDTTMPVASPNGESEETSFRIKNSIDLGVVSGLERKNNAYLLRLWMGYNYSASFLLKTKTRMSSLKTGADAYWVLFKSKGKLEVNLLTFLATERMAISRDFDRNSFDESTSQVVINGVSYQMAFAGLGLTLAW